MYGWDVVSLCICLCSEHSENGCIYVNVCSNVQVSGKYFPNHLNLRENAGNGKTVTT